MMSERKETAATAHARTGGGGRKKDKKWFEGRVDHLLRVTIASGARRLKG